MTATGVEQQDHATSPPTAPTSPATSRPAARAQGSDWAATCVDRATVWARLTRPPFAAALGNRKRSAHQLGIGLLLDWLDEQPGKTWQDRWLASGVDTAGRAWREIPLGWLGERGMTAGWQHDAFFRALYLAIAADVIRPSVSLLIAAVFRRGVLPNVLAQCRDAEGFTRLRALCSADPDINQAGATRISHRTAIIVAAKGGAIADITTGDVLELLEIEAQAHGTGTGAVHTFYRILHTMGVFGDQAPATLRELRTTGSSLRTS